MNPQSWTTPPPSAGVAASMAVGILPSDRRGVTVGVGHFAGATVYLFGANFEFGRATLNVGVT